MSQWFGVFQKFGKALMVPVALLPAAGILLGLGAALTGPLAESWTFLQNGTVEAISAGMLQIGLSIFANLPIIFAIGVAVGLSGGSGIAALAALVGYVIMNTTISIALGITPEMAAESGEYGMLLGIPSLETGVRGGIAVGSRSACLRSGCIKNSTRSTHQRCSAFSPEIVRSVSSWYSSPSCSVSL